MQTCCLSTCVGSKTLGSQTASGQLSKEVVLTSPYLASYSTVYSELNLELVGSVTSQWGLEAVERALLGMKELSPLMTERLAQILPRIPQSFGLYQVTGNPVLYRPVTYVIKDDAHICLALSQVGVWLTREGKRSWVIHLNYPAST